MGQRAAIGVLFLGVMGVVVRAEGGKKLPFEVSKETTVVVSPVTKEGTVDYVRYLNEKYGKGVKPEENGFVDWLKIAGTKTYGDATEQVLQLCGVEGLQIEGGTWDSYPNYLKSLQLSEEQIRALDDLEAREKLAVWKAGDDPHLAAYLEKMSDLFSRADAASKKQWWIPLVSDTGHLTGLRLPTLAAVRGIGMGLVERATLRAGKGDFSGFLEDVSTVKRLARSVASGRTTLERLVGLAMDSGADKAIGGVAGSGDLTAAQCDEIRQMIDSMPVLGGVADANDETERFWVLDDTQQMALSGEDFISSREKIEYLKPLFKPFHSIAFSKVDWNVVLKQINRRFDACTMAMRMTAWNDSKSAMKQISDESDAAEHDLKEVHKENLAILEGESREAYSERVAKAILVKFAPPLGRADELYRRGRMLEAMTDVVLDAAAEKARTGKWPEEIKGLLVDGCSKDGNTVKYVVREKGVEVYSVGENGKDDGGMRSGKADDLGVGAVPEVVP